LPPATMYADSVLTCRGEHMKWSVERGFTLLVGSPRVVAAMRSSSQMMCLYLPSRLSGTPLVAISYPCRVPSVS